MYGNNFWQEYKAHPETVAYENGTYVVLVTPKVWREQARSDTDHNLKEYVVVNRLYKTLESTADVLATAVQYADTMARILEEVTKEKEKPSATVIGFPSKDGPK